VIATSPTDLPTVLGAISERAATLLGATDALVNLRDGDSYVIEGGWGPIYAGDKASGNIVSERRVPISHGSMSGRVLLTGRPVHIESMAAVAEREFPELAAAYLQSSRGARLVVPLLRDADAIGTIVVRRESAGLFSDEEIGLLETFADQAVIAIENARLFDELERRNAQLTSALDQQTATAEVLRVIASAPTDLERVLEAIVETAARLCEAPRGVLLQSRERDGRLAPRARFWRWPELAEPNLLDFDGAPGVLPAATSAQGHAYVEGRTIHVLDMAEAVQHQYPDSRRVQQRLGLRSGAWVPLLRHGSPIGVLAMQRFEVRPFTDSQIRQ